MKMEFPKINKGQVVLMRAESLTGVLLDDKFNRVISKDQVFYSVFDNYESAVIYIDVIVKNKKNVEIIIYDNHQKVLHYYDPMATK